MIVLIFDIKFYFTQKKSLFIAYYKTKVLINKTAAARFTTYSYLGSFKNIHAITPNKLDGK